jgi:soluble lytic murein transglycosylase
MVAIAGKRPEDSGRSSAHWTQQDIANGAIQRGIVSQISQPSVGCSVKRGPSVAAPRPGIADTESYLQVHTICCLLALAFCLYGVFFLTLDLPSTRHTPPTPTPPPTPVTQQPVPPPSAAAITLEAYTRRVARTLGVDEALALAVLVQESDPVDPLKAGKGDSRGPLQIKPIALEDVGLSPDEHSLPALVRGGILYLKEMLIRFRSLPIALAAYNMGPECLRQRDYRPYTSTQDYISQVLVRAEAIRAGTFPPPPVLQYRTPGERAKG